MGLVRANCSSVGSNFKKLVSYRMKIEYICGTSIHETCIIRVLRNSISYLRDTEKKVWKNEKEGLKAREKEWGNMGDLNLYGRLLDGNICDSASL